MKKVLGIIFLLFTAVVLLFVGFFLWHFRPWITPECENKHAVFDEYTPYDNEYKQELAKLLQQDVDLHYWFQSYSFHNGEHHLLVHVKGENLCAQMDVISKGCNYSTPANRQPCGVIKAKGKGYQVPSSKETDKQQGGLQIRGFEYDIVEEDSTVNFYWKDYKQIVD